MSVMLLGETKLDNYRTKIYTLVKEFHSTDILYLLAGHFMVMLFGFLISNEFIIIFSDYSIFIQHYNI